MQEPQGGRDCGGEGRKISEPPPLPCAQLRGGAATLWGWELRAPRRSVWEEGSTTVAQVQGGEGKADPKEWSLEVPARRVTDAAPPSPLPHALRPTPLRVSPLG